MQHTHTCTHKIHCNCCLSQSTLNKCKTDAKHNIELNNRVSNESTSLTLMLSLEANNDGKKGDAKTKITKTCRDVSAKKLYWPNLNSSDSVWRIISCTSQSQSIVFRIILLWLIVVCSHVKKKQRRHPHWLGWLVSQLTNCISPHYYLLRHLSERHAMCSAVVRRYCLRIETVTYTETATKVNENNNNNNKKRRKKMHIQELVAANNNALQPSNGMEW